DPWAQRRDNLPGLMCADGEKWTALVAPPDGANSVEWPIEMTRASEAAPPPLGEKFRKRHQRLDQGANGGRCRPPGLPRPARRGGPRRPGTFCLITFYLCPGFEV